MPEQRTVFDAHINPLAFFPVDDPVARVRGEVPEVGIDDLLGFICTPGEPHDIAAVVARYVEVRGEHPDPLVMPPNDPIVMDSLVWPLRHAKGSFSLGNYLGCVALAGLVVEMLTLLVWDSSNVRLGLEPIGDRDRALFGYPFDRLSQSRRLAILRALDLIDDGLLARFERARIIRNHYIHARAFEPAVLRADAAEVYRLGVGLVASVIGQDFADGKVVLKPAIARYLRARGVMREVDDAG